MEIIGKEIELLRNQIYKDKDSLMSRKGYSLSKMSAYISDIRKLKGFSKSRLSDLLNSQINYRPNSELNSFILKLKKLKRILEAAPSYEDSVIEYDDNPIEKDLLNTVWKFFYYQKSDKKNEEKIKLACIMIGNNTNNVKFYTHENNYSGSIITNLPASLRMELSLTHGRPLSITCPIGQGALPSVFLGAYINLSESNFLALGIGVVVKDDEHTTNSDLDSIKKRYNMDSPDINKTIREYFSYKNQFYVKIDRQVYSMQMLDDLNAIFQRRASNSHIEK